MDTSDKDAESFIVEGNALEDEGRLGEALERYERAVRLAPNAARGHLNCGNVLLATGRIDGALEAFDNAIRMNPDYVVAYYNKGVAYMRCSRHGEALAALESAIARKPDFAEAHVALGCSLEELGQFDDAKAAYRRALDIEPNFAEVHNNLGNVHRSLRQFDDAAASYRRAISSKPDDAIAHYALGNTLQEMGKIDDAIASYRRTIEIKPDMAKAYWDLANALLGLGRFDEAIVSYGSVLELDPEFGEAHCNLANALKELGRNEDAVASYRRAIAINPGLALAHYNLGNALKNLHRLPEAAESYSNAIRIQPDMATAHCNLGSALLDLGKLDGAVASYRRAIDLDPLFAMAHNNLGNALSGLGRVEEAEKSYRRALDIDPEYAETHYNLGTVLKRSWRLNDAAVCFNRAIALNGSYASAHNNLGATLQDLGELREAAASYRRAVEINPDFAQGHSNLLFCLSHQEGVEPVSLFAEHCHFGKTFETPLRASWPAHTNTRDPMRTLRVGFVSADLRDHAVAYYIEPLLAHLATCSTLSLHAYFNHRFEDRVTARLRKHLRHWQTVLDLSDVAAAQKIERDGIDILVDLSGHTSENRLLAFARKPAPIQATWIGYPGTTGLEAMDYYLADQHFLPPRQFASQFTEKLVCLPASVPFLPEANAPPVNALPALSNRYLTFGSFNRLSKLNRSTVALWASLMRVLPDARMVLGGMPRDNSYGALIDWFAQEGIAQKRLSFYARSDLATYLELHHQVDICLDTFPYAGGTTTNHALWMGVPTLTIAGLTPAGRQGAAMLGRVGLEGFVAEDAADFQRKGLYWANDLAALAGVRAGLRERFKQSPISRPDIIASGLESALRTMWQRWCAGLPPESFTVDMCVDAS